MKVIVTGGSGHAGKVVVGSLITQDYNVRVADSVPPVDKNIPYKLCDLTDYGQAVDALKNADAVVHLAAIPRPTFHPAHILFRTNVLSAYNIFEAATSLGIQRIIYASSISVTGYPFYKRYFEPSYVPIDELHPTAPQDPYGLSKHLGEEIGKSFARQTDMNIISLRLPWIHTPSSFKSEISPYRHDPQFGASNLWLYVDARDVAQAVSLSLLVNLSGYHDFYIAAPDTFMKTPSVELVKTFYPATEIRPGLTNNQSLISSSKAEQQLGYKAQYCWSSYYLEENT